MTEIAGLRLGVALVIDKDAVFFEYTPRETSAAVGEMNRFEGGELVAIGEMSAVTAIGDLIRFLLQ